MSVIMHYLAHPCKFEQWQRRPRNWPSGRRHYKTERRLGSYANDAVEPVSHVIFVSHFVSFIVGSGLASGLHNYYKLGFWKLVG